VDLTGKQKRHLRALGHALKPVVMLGKEGLTEAIERKVNVELENHELIKVKVGEGASEETDDVAERLASSSGAAVAQIIGHTILLYRRRRKDPQIILPKATPPQKVSEEAD
jgi:RNA-binding protein